MAIFSLHHSTVGRTTHSPGTASAHAYYITRPDACTQVLGARMPVDRGELCAWLDEQEQVDRKNARVIDKVMVALPVELTHEQRAELVKDFCEGMSQGRAPWVAAIHDGPGDADNPHAHIIFRDRDFETGKRVMLLSEAGSTERLRVAWEQDTNEALEWAGLDIRVDRRSLEDQGIAREPEIHVGPAVRELTSRGERPESGPHELTRLIEGERLKVTIDYEAIDQGRTRIEENEERRARNAWRDLVSHPELDWTHRESMAHQQRAAMEWVRATYEDRLAHPSPVRPSDDDASDAVTPAVPARGEMTERKIERAAREANREQNDAVAEMWEARITQFGKAWREVLERDERDRGIGLGL
jgi:hypothetical protein